MYIRVWRGFTFGFDTDIHSAQSVYLHVDVHDLIAAVSTVALTLGHLPHNAKLN